MVSDCVLAEKSFDCFQPESHISQCCNKYSLTLSYSHVEDKKTFPIKASRSLICERLSYRAVIKGLEQLSVGLETEKPLRWGLRNNTLLLCFSVGSHIGHIFTLSKIPAGIQRLGQCIVPLERAVQRGSEVCVRV